jgi:hypothetical protein
MRRHNLKRFLIVLAALLNLGSGPLAFAHADPEQAAPQTSEHCAGHDSQAGSGDVPADDSDEPCCAAGHCACSAATVFMSAGAPALTRFVHVLRIEPRLPEPPSISLSDPLRPPIV